MPDSGRSPSKFLVFALALPILALVYVTTFGGRLWAVLRPGLATFLGATVIASVYGEEAYRRTPTPVRVASVVFLSITLVGNSFGSALPVAAADPAARVVAAARDYIGANYRLGTEGPRTFDCSGLIYRAFADAGELPRIGGMRLKARGYMQYFVSRGRFTKKESEARPGDLVIYARGKHVGIYVGDGKVISALIQPWGVTVHRMHGIGQQVSYILKVNWGGGDGGNDGGGGGGGGGDDGNEGGDGSGGNDEEGGNGRPGGSDSIGRPGDSGNDTSSAPDSSPDDTGNGEGGGDNGGEQPTDNGGNGGGEGGNEQPTGNGGGGGGGQPARPEGRQALALGTMNLRIAADPNARIIGWIGRNGTFRIIGEGKSPAGYDWYEVETRSGKSGWVYARWVRAL